MSISAADLANTPQRARARARERTSEHIDESLAWRENAAFRSGIRSPRSPCFCAATLSVLIAFERVRSRRHLIRHV